MKLMKKAAKLHDAERSEIEILHNRGYSARSIARVLGRSPNTIAQELLRNSYRDGRYVAARAKQKAYVRRKYAKYQGKKIEEQNELRSFIVRKLGEKWNPDEIAGYLKCHPNMGMYVSKSTIYEWLHSARGQAYCPLLYSRRYRRKPRKQHKTDRVTIPERTSITERPVAALNRAEAGHCEYDSIVSGKRTGSKAALAVLVERSSRLVRASLVTTLKPEAYAQTVITLAKDLRPRSLTTDNGIENKQHRLITKSIGTPVFFTDPYSSWQKGSVENANRMLRQYFPKGTDFATVTETDVVTALTLINNKPRKILGYKSSLQIALEKGLIVEGVS